MRIGYPRPLWRALWVALRRGYNDPDAGNVLVLYTLRALKIFGCVYFFGTFFYMALVDLGRAGVLTVLAAVSLVALLTVVILIRNRLQDGAVSREELSVASEVKVAIYREACLLAILLERLGWEIEMEKELPPNIRIIARRVLLDRVAKLNLREGLAPWQIDVLLLPDGHWPAALKERAIPAWECLAVLLWVLGLSELRDLTLKPHYKFSDARALCAVAEPQNLRALPVWEIRPARNAAQDFCHRCFYELVARGFCSAASAGNVVWTLELRRKIQSAGYTSDYLIGSRTVPELPSPKLSAYTRRAFDRMRMLSLLVDIAEGEKPVAEIRTLLSQFFTVVEQPEAPEAEGSG